MEPSKYWETAPNDIRVNILKQIAEKISPAALETQNSSEIVRLSIDTLKHFEISSEERAQLKENILQQNASILEECLNLIRETLTALGSKKISLISLGCGDESVFERSISEDIEKSHLDIELEWLGVDTDDFRNMTSFLKDKPFKKIDPNVDIEYRALVDTSNPVVLLGRWSYHHLDISFEKFLERCKGISKVILIEEPAVAGLWVLPDYRVMRIAYDLLGNIIMSQSWANEFMKDPNKFKVQYLSLENLPANSKVINFQKVIPETSLIVVEP